MTTYQITVLDEPDEETRPLDRLGAAPVGMKSADWPRCRGVPMQLLATVELDGRWNGRDGVVMVFVDSYTETDVGDPDGVAVRLADRASIETIGETTPPDDYVAERWPDESDRVVCLDGLDDPEVGDDDSYLGPVATWPEETGEPDDVPGGAFLMRLMGHDVPLGRGQNVLMVFEQGAVITPQYEPDDDEAVVPWPEAIARSREIVIVDEAPEADALVKFGGAPRAACYWPTDSRGRPLAHLMTLPAELLRDADEDAVAVAYYIDLRRAGLSDWDAQPDFIEADTITAELLEEELELPEGVELLPEKRLELRPFAGALTWRDLVGKSFVGPRGAFLNPEADCADPGYFEMQLATSLIPNCSVEGALYFLEGSNPYFQRPGDTGRGGDDDSFFAFGYDDYGEEEADDEQPSGGISVRRGEDGESSTSYTGGLPPAIGLENWPRFEGELMTHVMTLDLRAVPDLADRGAAAISVFVSTAMHHKAFGPDTKHSAVLALKAERLDGRCEPPAGEIVEILDEHPLVLEHQEPLDDPMVFAGGDPRWLQAGQHFGLFVAQVDEQIVDINLGDCGVLYVFADTAFFQCH